MNVEPRLNNETHIARLPFRVSTWAITILLCAIIVAVPDSQAALADPPTEQPLPADDAKAISVTNYSDGDVIRYPVALLTGELKDAEVKSISLTNRDSTLPSKQITGQAFRGRFKVLAELRPGNNRLLLVAGKDELTITLGYKPQTNPYFVRMVYMTDNTGDTTYQSAIARDPQDYANKLDTAMKLMQTFTAERMHDLGYPRQTFNMELDEDGKVIVHLFKGAKAAEEYYKLNDQVWYGRVSREVGRSFPMSKAKNIVIASYSRFDPVTKKTQGHTALGGGDQGLFGSGNLFTWPSTLAGTQAAFMNDQRMDNTKVQDDSGGRGTYWGAAATTIGATLHEMGHAFGLPHSRDQFDIMTRGFDQFNRAFTLTEPKRRQEPQPYKADQIAAFTPISAEALLLSRWFELDERQVDESNELNISFDATAEAVVVKSKVGVRYVAVQAKGDAVLLRSPPRDKEPPVEFQVPLAEIRKAIPTGDFSIRAINADGHVTHWAFDSSKSK